MVRGLLCLLPLLCLRAEAKHGKEAAPFDPNQVTETIGNAGMIIDAGSGGSRLHVYRWEKREFETLPPPITYPLTQNEWTHRLKPGISSFAKNPEDVGQTLVPLINFAKTFLTDSGLPESEWSTYPIFLRATGGMRELPDDERAAIMQHVAQFLGDTTLTPFYFRDGFARVISGEEEGTFAWAAINFQMGSLLRGSTGVGTAVTDVTYGALDMGGASTQISFYKKDQTIMSNLFKLQIGDQKHWNVYTHSFLYFGLNSARLRMLQGQVDARYDEGGTFGRRLLSAAPTSEDELVRLTDGEGNYAYVPKLRELSSISGGGRALTAADGAEQEKPVLYDACMPAGAEPLDFVDAENTAHIVSPRDTGSSYDACYSQVFPLLEKQYNVWCNFAHNHDCSFAGIYQPPLPSDQSCHFYAFANYYDTWRMSALPETVTLLDWADRAALLCGMDIQQLTEWGKANGRKKSTDWSQACYQMTYVLTILIDGYGFTMQSPITFLDTLNGYKIGWALGSMLYEACMPESRFSPSLSYQINALPWKYVGPGTAEFHKKEKDEREKTTADKLKSARDKLWGPGKAPAATVGSLAISDNQEARETASASRPWGFGGGILQMLLLPAVAASLLVIAQSHHRRNRRGYQYANAGTRIVFRGKSLTTRSR